VTKSSAGQPLWTTKVTVEVVEEAHLRDRQLRAIRQLLERLATLEEAAPDE
jgi:hypothetical protein